MKVLQRVKALRVAFFGLHAILVIGIVVLVSNRNASVPVAAIKLEMNHQLVVEDLRVAETEPLLGRYLRQRVDAGQPITAAMLSPLPLVPQEVNSLAALVISPAALARQRHITVGAPVTLILKKVSVQVSGKVLWQDCNARYCVHFVGLPKLPAPAMDSDAFADADISLAPPAKGP